MIENFLPYPQAFLKEAEYRDNIDFSKLCRYGIKPLDDAMRAIAPRELIVIAAGSGFGKTELALSISRHNALRGKKVIHFNLEGGYQEAVARMTWRDMCDIYFKEYSEMGVELDYRKWVLNEEHNPLIMKLASMSYANLKDKLGNKLYFYDNRGGLTYDLFAKSLKCFHSDEHIFDTKMMKMTPKRELDADLIVVDHIHYFRFPDEKEEIRAMTDVMMACKDITELYDIPVVMVAHIRKLPRGHGIPDKEDIYGTSNIHKIANTCIILSPDHEKDDAFNGLYPTFIRIAKSRQGLRPNILINSIFDIKTRKYQDRYELYKCGANGDVATEPIPWGELPRWAREQHNQERMI